MSKIEQLEKSELMLLSLRNDFHESIGESGQQRIEEALHEIMDTKSGIDLLDKLCKNLETQNEIYKAEINRKDELFTDAAARNLIVVQSLKAENELLRGALEFYADKQSWKELLSQNGSDDAALVHIDYKDHESLGSVYVIGGKTAREALAKCAKGEV